MRSVLKAARISGRFHSAGRSRNEYPPSKLYCLSVMCQRTLATGDVQLVAQIDDVIA